MQCKIKYQNIQHMGFRYINQNIHKLKLQVVFIFKKAFTSRQRQENRSLTVLQAEQLQFVRSAEDPSCWGQVHKCCCWNSSLGTYKVCQGQVQGTESSEFYASSTRSWTGGPMARQMLLTCAPLVTVTESRLRWYSFSCVNI